MTHIWIFLLTLLFSMGSPAMEENADFRQSTLAAKSPPEVYRRGSATDNNLTPRPQDTRGLSTNIKPPPGKSQLVDTTKLEKLEAVQDGADHASVRPRDPKRMQEWIDSRSSDSTHEFTKELRDSIKKK